MKTIILTMKYSSIKNVAEDIASVLRNNNEIVHIYTDPWNLPQADKLIVFVPFNPPLLNNYLMTYYYFKGEKYFYTTVDGVPNLNALNQYLAKEITYIPNSKHSARNLQDAGLNVDLPVFHGVNFEKVKKAEALVPQLKNKLAKDFPNSTKFGVVSGTTKRKNIDLLLQAFNILNTKYPEEAKNIHFFVISHEDFLKNEVPQNVHFVSKFGYQSHEEIFAFYRAMDYMIVPSGCEGFGLPVLESMAVGTPVIHQLIPPFDEFTSWQYNFLIKHEKIEEYYAKEHAQKWKIYRFNPEDLVIAILMAKNSQDREERSEKLREIAKAYDINLLYKRFIE
ncbi:glycosyltransferase [Stygiolobus rod-shaped virus]|uniref:Glycosyl transferase family 1 domain-containing protein n=1 Tax=Stygiolobus rod-shaped virus TaxID=537009 RepID=B6EFC4_9VIRU|nr:glycosyltransferase [Stygiolobus rod-shaped virus]CAQ58459.1 hypothetical protein [Stygiolobus rod-shaped virus]